MHPSPFTLEQLEGAPPDDVDVVIFPEFVEDGVGVYRANLIPLKKELVELGVRADYAYPPERRTWLRELSAGQTFMNIAIGLGTSGTVAVVQQLLARRDRGTRVKVRITKARKAKGRKLWDADFVDFEGTADDVAAMLDRWLDSDDSD